MRDVTKFNEGWVFVEGFDPKACGRLQSGDEVTLPHNAVELPFSYCDETLYQKCFTYQKRLLWEPRFEGREVELQFDGAMANAEVYLNGEAVAAHRDGYTPFQARLTAKLRRGSNLITVKVDGSENPEIPPFGGKIDYLTYAGIYRDVWLRVAAPVFLRNLKIQSSDPLSATPGLSVDCYLGNPQGLPLSGSLTARLFDPSGSEIAAETEAVTGAVNRIGFTALEGIRLWDLDNPVLYRVEVELKSDGGRDCLDDNFGFRTAAFTAKGFLLNGKPLKLMGLNRHQSFPYSGYAQGRFSQERDAEILKFELSCNLVRTSHYPQSSWFLKHCDRIGLLVIEEIPGWQHIGGQRWKAEAVANVRRMIERDWNHPSVICWGVRINESNDDHDFYAATNALARELDETRQTCGVRKHRESELLEDVYSMNDFTLGSEELEPMPNHRVPLKDQRANTGLDRDVPYLVTEYNGHMYPTKVSDHEERQVEHVLRHLQVLNQAFGDPGIAGCIGWCMFDYNTHKDFGSGDRICHHGVMTMFREPKFAAYAYASQGSAQKNPVLKPVTYWTRGERNIGGVLPLVILTNCDEVELRFANGASKRFPPARERFAHLPHPPVIIERSDVSETEFGQWGKEWEAIEIAGFLNGQVAATKFFVADPLPDRLQVVADKAQILADEREELRVIVRALDQAGSVLPFLADQITIGIDGPASLIGPPHVPLVGGTTGFWVKSTGQDGEISITVSSNFFDSKVVTVSAGSAIQ